MKTILLSSIAMAISVTAVYCEFENWQISQQQKSADWNSSEFARDSLDTMIPDPINVPQIKKTIIASAPQKNSPQGRVVKTTQRVQFTAADEKCLAMNIFYEAGIEQKVGQIAVGHVTLNRLAAGRWGDDICSVVYSKAQFSWTLFKDKRKVVPKGENWEVAQVSAKQVLNGARVSSLNQSLFYHTDYIRQPKWAGDEHKIEQIGQHLFYTRARLADSKI